MKMNRATLAVVTLLGFSILLQTGCKKGKEPGTAMDAESEIFNIEYAIKKSSKPRLNKAKRIRMMRSAYEAAGDLTTRWPDDPTITSFLAETDEKLRQIPQAVYTLSIDVKDLESFKWAINHSAQVNTDSSQLLKFWSLGPQWRAYILEGYPEIALPLYMNEAVENNDADFFNQHIEAFKATGFKLNAPVIPSIFYLRYCHLMAEQFSEAMKENNLERISLLLGYMPRHSAVESLDAKTLSTMRKLGDYLCHTQKDEALASQLIQLQYPLNRIDLSAAGFSSDFMKTLGAQLDYAITTLQLDQWHGPLAQQETVFLLGLPPETLQTVDSRYIDDTVKLCLSKNKNKLALKLIQARAVTHPLTDQDYENMLNWAIETGNDEFFKYVMTQRKDMKISDIRLEQLAKNDAMFLKYAPKVITYLTQHEGEEGVPDAAESIRTVVVSTNHKAATYLIKKYDLSRKWERAPQEPSLLMHVCLAGNLPAAKYLIETKRKDVDERTYFVRAETSVFGSSNPVEGNLNLIHMAAKSGNKELIKYLAGRKVGINTQTYYGVTPLMYAVSNGHLDATVMLISLGAQVNTSMNAELQNGPMPENGSFKQLSTAYNRAQANNHKEILEVLKKAGARP